jgi:hypothetical protein
MSDSILRSASIALIAFGLGMAVMMNWPNQGITIELSPVVPIRDFELEPNFAPENIKIDHSHCGLLGGTWYCPNSIIGREQ